ncbi:MAG: esterase/lipase family protein [Gammaproteobacteria bacterium]
MLRLDNSRAALRKLLLVQACAAGAIAWVAHQFGQAHWAPAVALGLGAVLLVRAAITANNFAMSARFASATPERFRLSWWGRLRLFGGEFIATILHSSWFMARAVPRLRIYHGGPVPPVLLLHGYGCNSGYWAHLTPLLDAARISHASIDMEPLLAGIDEFVPQVAAAIDQLCERSGARQVILVGHSMGGLVARAYLRTHGAARVAHIFTLGTPHHGTALADAAPGINARQMRRWDGAAALDNAWLAELAASESPTRRALITSIYTHHDNIVSPQTSSQLPGANNIELGGVGHVALGSNPAVLARLLQEIAMMFTR